MPKIQIYVPQELHERLQREGAELNVSALFQRSLDAELAELARRRALDELIAHWEKARGKPFTREELDAQLASDKKHALRPLARRRSRSRVA